jgi:polyisoprenoid-binding protein YceI
MKKGSKIAGLSVVALLVFTAVSFMFKPDYANSSISFKIKNASINVNGTFKTFETSIDFNEAFNGPSYVKTTIQTTSVDTGIEGRDNHLRKNDFFDAAQFPTMTFESSKIRKSTNGSFIADGKLVIKGVSKDVSVPFTYTGNASSGVFEGGVKVNRLDYGVGGKSLTMSDDVEVTFKITASR